MILFNTVILLYCIVQLFTWGLYNYLLNNNLNTKIVSDLGYVSNIAYYICIGFILYYSGKKSNDGIS